MISFEQLNQLHERLLCLFGVMQCWLVLRPNVRDGGVFAMYLVNMLSDCVI